MAQSGVLTGPRTNTPGRIIDGLGPIDDVSDIPPLIDYMNVYATHLGDTTNFSRVISCHRSGIGGNVQPIWDEHWFLGNRPVSHLAVQTLCLSTLPRVLHEFFKHFGLPLIVFQVAAGILFGQAGLANPAFIKMLYDHFNKNISTFIKDTPGKLFPSQSHEVLDTWALFCGMFYLFKVGVKTDVTMIRRCGLKPIVIAGISFFIANGFGRVTAMALDSYMYNSTLKLIQISSNTSFPVIAIALTDLNILNSDLGNLATSVSLYIDLIHFLLTILITEVGVFRISFSMGLKSMACLISFFAFIYFVGRKALAWIERTTPEGRPVKEMYISFIFVLVLACGLTTEVFGYYAMTGAFLMGLVVPDGPPVGLTLVNKLENLVTSLYMPLMVGLSGLKLEITAGDELSFLPMGFIVMTCFLGKFIGVTLTALYAKVPLREALLLGLVLNIKGVVDYNNINIWMDAETLNANTSLAAILVFPVVTAIFTPLVKYLYDPRAKYLAYMSRPIAHAKDNIDFPMLVCVHDTKDVSPILRFLENSVPTKPNATLSINLVHLIELVGRATPLLISYPPNKKILTSNNQSKTERIINVFRQFEECYQTIVFVQAFSTICPYASMHNDIYNMAMEKRSSLIIIPFPVKQNEIEDSHEKEHSQPKKRVVIRNLLERTPCTVGIFVDRSIDGMSNSISMDPYMYHVGMLFFGGPDDREALAYAMKMSGSAMVNLTVVRFVDPSDMTSFATKEGMHDKDMIDCLKNDEMMNNKRIVYSEENVNDGAETIWAVRSMKDRFDLIIVGRRQVGLSNLTKGLGEWSEVEELGLIGDLVSSSDMGKGSVLVIQVQQDDYITMVTC